ncbi:MAG: hypothetical protein GKR90_19130 [Pseudomonadales bacterium]|nr:hypothetical protein [Pseudomonadales bacterium]
MVTNTLRETLVANAQGIADTLIEHAPWAEINGRLHDEAVAALVGAGIPRLYLPEALGGLAVDPVTCAQVAETLADADTAAAWHVMVFNAARIMGASWPGAMVSRLWLENPDTLVAASGHTPLVGKQESGGYRVSGTNSFVSGCHHADYMMAPMICDGNMSFAVVPMTECRIEDNWDTLGMRGTGSNDVTVENVLIDADMVAWHGEAITINEYYDGQLYRCPSRLVFATYIPVALSLARRALAELVSLAKNKVPYASDAKLKNRVVAQMHYGRGLAKFRSTHAYFYATLDSVWQQAGEGHEFNAEDRADLYLAGTHTMQACAEIVRHVADAAGSSVLTRGQPLERIVRDMETLKHHGFANESRYASVAQVLWGAELDYPLLLR